MRTSAVLIVGAVLGILGVGTVADRPSIAQDKPAPVVKWEYKTAFVGSGGKQGEPEASMNKLGDEGWELVAVYTGNQGYFKRPKR